MKTMTEVAIAIARSVLRLQAKEGHPDGESDWVKAISARYLAAMQQAFWDGGIRVHGSLDLLPIDRASPSAAIKMVTSGVLPINEVNRWLDDLGIPVSLSDRDFVAGGYHFKAIEGRLPDAHWSTDPYWIAIGHAHADRIAQRNYERGYGGTSQRDVMDAVTVELKRDPVFPAPAISSERVRKVILKGWKWQPTIISPTARAVEISGASGASGAARGAVIPER
jgi:hypothetical protein